MHGEGLEVARRRHIDVADVALHEPQLQVTVHAAGGTESRARGESADVIAVAQIGVVGDGEDDFVRALLENAFRNR